MKLKRQAESWRVCSLQSKATLLEGRPARPPPRLPGPQPTLPDARYLPGRRAARQLLRGSVLLARRALRDFPWASGRRGGPPTTRRRPRPTPAAPRRAEMKGPPSPLPTGTRRHLTLQGRPRRREYGFYEAGSLWAAGRRGREGGGGELAQGNCPCGTFCLFSLFFNVPWSPPWRPGRKGTQLSVPYRRECGLGSCIRCFRAYLVRPALSLQQSPGLPTEAPRL